MAQFYGRSATLLGAAVFAAAALLAGCGAREHGTTPTAVGETAGAAADDTFIASLAATYGIETPPFETLTTERGARKAPDAVLLWPKGDVRLEGLRTFALEVSETYDGSARLEFRRGREVLHSAAFEPQTLTTVAVLPLEVHERVEVGDHVTWGLYFEGKRKPITADVKVISHPRADRKLEELRVDDRFQREPPAVRKLLIAQALENYRLYSEALVTYLQVAEENPALGQPYKGMVTTLRRLEADDSRLWAVAAPFVGGAGSSRRTTPGGQNPAGLAANVPVLPPPVPPVPGAASNDATGRLPSGNPTPAPSSGAAGGSGSPGGTGTAPEPTPPAPKDPRAEQLEREIARLEQSTEEATKNAEEMTRHAEQTRRDAEAAREYVQTAREGVVEAAERLAQAEGEAAEDPSPEHQAAVEQAHRDLAAAQQAVHDAVRTTAESQRIADEAEGQAEAARQAAAALAARAEAARRELEAMGAVLPGGDPEPTRPGERETKKSPPSAPSDTTVHELGQIAEQKMSAAIEARASAAAAARELEAAREALANGEEGAALRVAEAERMLVEASRAADEAGAQAEHAMRVWRKAAER